MLLPKAFLAALLFVAWACLGAALELSWPTGIGCPGNSTLDRAAAYTSVKRSPRWEHVRELATDPYFSIHHAALKRYASTQSPRFVENDEIVIILMASEQRADRARMQRETWLRNYPHLFIVGDAADPSVPMITLPELEGRATYADAQHRQLRYMRFLYEHRPDLLDKRYSFLVDDDTWINMPLVQTLLAHYDETLPFALGLVLHTAPPPQGNDGLVLSWLGGGSGIFMSQAAFRAVAQEMYGELCPFDRFNDVTLAHCFSTLGILKVNDDGCHAKSLTEDEPTIAEQVFNQALAIHSGKERDLHYLTSLHSHLSFHHMFDRTQLAEVTCVAEWESGFIDDVLPCRPGDRPVARAQLRSRKLIV